MVIGSNHLRTLFGRKRELAELTEALTRALAGHGRLVILSGPAGIGKTRLAEEIAAHGAHRGAQVVWGRGWQSSGAPPFWLWAQLLRPLVRESGADEVVRSIGSADLEQLLRDAAGVVPRLDEPQAPTDTSASSAAEQRFAFFDAVGRLLRELAATRPRLLILDDLHEADLPSLLLLATLARDLENSPLFVLATCRESEGWQDAERSRVLVALSRSGRRVSLAGLSDAELTELIEEIGDKRPSPALVSGIQRIVEGNPFFAQELVRALMADHGGQLPAELPRSGLRIPQVVAEVIRAVAAPLPPHCRAVLDAAAIIGREIDFVCLRDLVALTDDELIGALLSSTVGSEAWNSRDLKSRPH